MRILAPPNLLRCLGCGRTEEIGADTAVPARCPDCEKAMTVRCGTGPRPKNGREHPCYAPSKLGARCSKHGGRSLKGIASPTFKDGSRSRYVPARYQGAYDRSMADPAGQSENRQQLALLDGMEEELLRRIGTGESGAAWSALRAAAAALREQLQAIRAAGELGDIVEVEQLSAQVVDHLEAELLPIVDQGVGEEAARGELRELFLERSRLVRVQQQGQNAVPVAVLQALQARFVALVSQHITDRNSLSRLIAELREESQLPAAGPRVMLIEKS